MRPVAAAMLVVAATATGCGKSGGFSLGGGQTAGGQVAGAIPYVATRNTTRLAAADPASIAAAAALAAYPSGTGDSRPQTVALASAGDWRAALVASELMSSPLRAPLLLTDGGSLPSVTRAALARMKPRQTIGVGTDARPAHVHATALHGANIYALAAATAAYVNAAHGAADNRVLIVGADAPRYAMPAAGWAAQSGDPILFVGHDSVPPETRDAIGRLQQPRIYVLGPDAAVGRGAIDALRKLGRVKRISGRDPISNAIAFARYRDGSFGWNVVNPGHGLVFVDDARPLDAAAAAALSSTGSYGPALVVEQNDTLPSALRQYLLDIQPGYVSDPVRGVYNHGWLIGDERAISLSLQARIDTLLQIVQVSAPTTPAPAP